MRQSHKKLLSGLTYYCQYRADHGMHMGIEVDGIPLWESFQPGKGEPNPILLWYVDLRGKGKKIPASPPAIRLWLFDQGPAIKAAFQELAHQLEVGMDQDVYPVQWPVPLQVPGVQLTIVCFASHRVLGREMAQIVAKLGHNWEKNLEQLQKPLGAAV